MSERRVHTDLESAPAPTPPTAPVDSGRVRKQSHTVPLHACITVHGGIFTVKEYRWHLRNPAGDEVPLMNGESPEPSFIPDTVGDYVLRLTTEDGRAELTYHVVEV